MTRVRFRCERGQSLVEVVALVPFVILCGLLATQALVAGANRVAADGAVHAAMVASLTGRDVERAARMAVPGWSRGRVDVSANERNVVVRLRPRAVIPELSSLLEVRSSVRLPTGSGR